MEYVIKPPFIVRASRAPYKGAVEITIFQLAQNNMAQVLTASDVCTVNEGAVIEPTLVISLDVAQMLMDELWLCGIRPTDGAGSAGAMKAAEDNLKDLRDVTSRLFSLLEKRT